MTIISSISTALEKVKFSDKLNALPLPLTSFSYMEPLFGNLKDSASSVAAVVVILATSYYVFTNVLDLDKPKGYRDIPKLNTWKVLYYQFKSLPTNVKYTRSMKDVQEKYGISRVNLFGVNIVHVASPEYAHQILKNADTIPKLNMNDTQPDTIRARTFGYNMVQSNGDVWRRQRRICNPAFHGSWSTDTFGERTNAVINEILSHHHPEDGTSTINIGIMAKRMTLDALGKIAFDYDFNSVENPNNNFSPLYHTVLDGIVSPLYFFFPWLEKVPPFRRNKLRNAIKLFDEFLLSIVAAKREKLRLAAESGLESEDGDLLSLMIKANVEGSLSDDELRANMFIFFIAGHDTTANALACAFYHIASNPEVQERLHAEITDVLGPSIASNGTPVPTTDESKDMELVNAVIKETMRLNTSLEILSPRVVTIETTIGPYTLPVGTLVQVNIHSIHLNPKYWEHPEEFDLDRFIKKPTDHKDGVKNEKKKDSLSWLSFSAGSRVCLGINFSLIEQRVALCMLIHKFKISLPADSPHKDGIKFGADPIKSPKDLYLQFTPRY